MEAPGIENDQRRVADTIEHRKARSDFEGIRPMCQIVHLKCAIDRGDVTDEDGAYELSNVVETALARALVLAAEAKRWDVVVRIAAELDRRRVGMAQDRHRVNRAR